MGGQVVAGVVLVLTRHETCLCVRQRQCACGCIELSPQLSQEVPLLQGTGVTHKVIDVLVDECYEVLFKGCPVAEKRCTSCWIALLYEGNPRPGRYREVTKTKYVNCRAIVTY